MRTVLAVAIPLMLQQLITGSVNLIDNLMVGRLGDYAIGGVAAVNRYYMIATFGTSGLMAASSIFIAQYYGAGNQTKMQESFHFALTSSLATMILFCALGLLFPRSIIAFFTDDPQIIEMGIEYIRVVAWAFLPYGLSLAVSNAIRAVGETKLPFYISSAAVVTNTVMNYCLIFGKLGFPALGVIGAAVATLIARIVEMALYLISLRINDFPFTSALPELFRVPADLVRRILIKAAPLALNEVLWSGGMAVLYKFYATRGPEVLSGYSIASTVGDLFFILFGGMAAATTVLVAQLLGAGRLAEARANAYKLIGFSVLLSLFFGLAMYGSTFIVPYLYTGVSPQAKSTAILFLRIQSALFWIYMIATQCYFTLRSGGDMKHTLLLDSCFMWCVNIPLVAAFTYLTKVPILALYLIGQSTDVLKMAWALHLLRREKWVNNLAAEQPGASVI